MPTLDGGDIQMSWKQRHKRLIGALGIIGAISAGLAAFSGQVATIGESIQKLVSLFTGPKSGIEIRSVKVDPEPILIGSHSEVDVLLSLEIGLRNKGDHDATNCKAQFVNMFADTDFDKAIPHGIGSQFRLTFAISRYQYSEDGSLRVICDGIITKPVAVKLPTVTFSD